MSSFPANFGVLSCVYDMRRLDEDGLARRCEQMCRAGYSEIYFSDIFFDILQGDEAVGATDVLVKDPGMAFVARPDDELLRIRQILEQGGLAVGGAHFLQVLPAVGKPAEAIFPLHERLIQMAEVMGLSRLTTHVGWQMGVESPHVDTDDEKLHADSLTVYRNLCDIAGRSGITMAIETACQSWSWLDESPENLAAFIDEVGTDNLGVCLDAGHCHVVGVDMPELIRTLGPKITETHFHDNFGPLSPKFLECDLHNPVGIGSIDWRSIMLAMRDSGYRGIITFEQQDYQTNVTNWRAFLSAVERAVE